MVEAAAGTRRSGSRLRGTPARTFARESQRAGRWIYCCCLAGFRRENMTWWRRCSRSLEPSSFSTGVRMQPGKPVVFGRLPAHNGATECYFFGLPGNPVSTQVTFHCFVEPMLRAIGGAGVAGSEVCAGYAGGGDVRGQGGVNRAFCRPSLRHDLEKPSIRLVGRWQGSGDLTANARAKCYAVLPDGMDLKAGDVMWQLFRPSYQKEKAPRLNRPRALPAYQTQPTSCPGP